MIPLRSDSYLTFVSAAGGMWTSATQTPIKSNVMAYYREHVRAIELLSNYNLGLIDIRFI
jgi:hypothetical protein